MTLTNQEIRGTIKGILIATATWMIVIPLREYLIETSPIKNPWILGAIVLGIVLFWDD